MSANNTNCTDNKDSSNNNHDNYEYQAIKNDITSYIILFQYSNNTRFEQKRA